MSLFHLMIGSTPPSSTSLQGAKKALLSGRSPSAMTAKSESSLLSTGFTMVWPKRKAEEANTLDTEGSTEGSYLQTKN